MQITDDKYFKQFNDLNGSKIDDLIDSINLSEQSISLVYNTQSSAVYSSNIEGNSIDLNSFMNFKLNHGKFKAQKEIQEIENLVLAYQFAQSNPLNEKNFLHCHKIFSKTLVIKSNQGKYRNEKVGIFSNSGLVYLALEPEFVKREMTQFFADIEILFKMEMSKSKVFYFASLIHLVFAHIHPFRDGNGRAARLLEKWFLAEKLGNEFWNLPSEKYYLDHQSEYYKNINLGVNYYELNYDKCMEFLGMLVGTLKNE